MALWRIRSGIQRRELARIVGDGFWKRCVCSGYLQGFGSCVHSPLFRKLSWFLSEKHPSPAPSAQELQVGLPVGTPNSSLHLPIIRLVQGWTYDPITAKEHMQHLLGLLGERKVLFLTGLELGVHLAMQTSCHHKCRVCLRVVPIWSKQDQEMTPGTSDFIQDPESSHAWRHTCPLDFSTV